MILLWERAEIGIFNSTDFFRESLERLAECHIPYAVRRVPRGARLLPGSEPSFIYFLYVRKKDVEAAVSAVYRQTF